MFPAAQVQDLSCLGADLHGVNLKGYVGPRTAGLLKQTKAIFEMLEVVELSIWFLEANLENGYFICLLLNLLLNWLLEDLLRNLFSSLTDLWLNGRSRLLSLLVGLLEEVKRVNFLSLINFVFLNLLSHPRSDRRDI